MSVVSGCFLEILCSLSLCRIHLSRPGVIQGLMMRLLLGMTEELVCRLMEEDSRATIVSAAKLGLLEFNISEKSVFSISDLTFARSIFVIESFGVFVVMSGLLNKITGEWSVISQSSTKVVAVFVDFRKTWSRQFASLVGNVCAGSIACDAVIFKYSSQFGSILVGAILIFISPIRDIVLNCLKSWSNRSRLLRNGHRSLNEGDL